MTLVTESAVRPRRRRVVFRPFPSVSQAESLPERPAELRFHPTADVPGTDRDVLMGYQIFLGRDPETSFVISNAKANAVRHFITGLLASAEFTSAVATPLQRGLRIPHDRVGPTPAPEHIAWIAAVLMLEPPARAALAEARDWTGFWRALAAVPGMPLTAAPRPTAPDQARVTATDADDGFVLITLDQPKPGEKLHAGAPVSGAGWAIAPAEIIEVGVYLDETLLSHARYGLPRPDVARNFPHYRHVDHCGFAFSTQVPNDASFTDRSQLVIEVKTASGQIGRRGIRIEPPARAAAPLWPIRVQVDESRVDPDGQLRVRGWAVAHAGVARVAVFAGDRALGDAELGLARPDIAASHPAYADAARAGFVFAASLKDHPPGRVSLRLQVIDREGQMRSAIVPITVRGPAGGKAKAAAAAADQAEGLFFECETATLLANGGIAVGGWALADSGLHDIAVSLDGRALGQARLMIDTPEIARRFPGHRRAARAGFAFTAGIAEGPFPAGSTVTLTARTKAGEAASLEATLLPERGAGQGVAVMRLEIDSPTLVEGRALGQVRGALTITGWAVAPEGIKGISVLCDGQPLGDAYCGRRREDIARAFPDYQDSLRAGFALALAPGAISEGPHDLVVVATSNDGVTTENQFSISVTGAEVELPGSMPRLSMPRAECRFTEATLNARRCHPDFRILLTTPATAEGDAVMARPLARAMARTLLSLARQTYGAFHLTIVANQPAAMAAAHSARGTSKLGDRVSVGALPPGRPGRPPEDRPALFMSLLPGDELGCDALLELAAAYATDRTRGFIYADDNRPDAARQRNEPFYKPDFAPELLLSMDYIGRPWCADAALLQRARLEEADLARLTPYDAALRLTETGGGVHHVNRVLASLGAITDVANAAPALRDMMRRRNLHAAIEPGRVAGAWRLRRAVTTPATVSVIIPTAGRNELIRAAIGSLRATTARGALEIIVLDNIPRGEVALKDWLRGAADRVITVPYEFNWSQFNNIGAAAASGDYLLFLNDDIEATAEGWLEAMLEYAQRPDVGVVGARLLYPDGKVQHGGQYLAENHARHAFRFADADDPGPFGLATVAREMSSVTGACQMIRTDIFNELGRFDEAHDVINNDLDFCLRAQRAGLKVIFTPHVSLTHHELASRAGIDDHYDIERFSGEWRLTLLRGDPFHSRHLMAEEDQIEPRPEPVQTVHAGPAGPAAAAIERILAIKLDHIGDFLTAVPALRALKRHFPSAHLTLLAPPATAALARREEAVDEVTEFTFFHARSVEGQRQLNEDELIALAAQLTPERFDMAIDLRMQPETRRVLRHTGAPLLVGYDHEGRFPWLDVALEWEGDRRLETKHAHISERLLALVDAAAAACRDLPPVDLGPPADPMAVPALARLGRPFLSRPLVCVHPGVGNPVRQWSPAYFAALIDLLVTEDGMHAILIGGGDEQAIAQEVMALVTQKDAVISLVGSLKLADLAAVMQACAIFVGNNSGPKHIAAACGVPVIGIHSGVVDAREWAPLGGAAMALQRRVVCSPCYLEFASDCPRALACLTGIRPRDVLAACRRALALRPARPGRRARRA